MREAREKSGNPNAATSFWKRVYSDPEGRLHVRQGRWKSIMVYGTLCRYCKAGILWIKKEDTRVQVSIEPWSWKGEDWYTLGKHRLHLRRCEGTRRRVLRGRRGKVDPDLIL